MPQLTVPSETCTASSSSGRFCDRPSVPDAPFPICLKHAALMVRFLSDLLPYGAVTELSQPERKLPDVAGIPMPDEDSPIVYYMRIGEHIKIGYSANFTVRRRFYPPDSELLAIEHGDRELEARRLRQFRGHLSMRQEWFLPAPELMAHIERLRAA